MRANTAIGELLIKTEQRDYLLRPSFAGIQRLGANHHQINQVMREVFGCFEMMVEGTPPDTRKLSLCAGVLDAFCDEDLPLELTGYETGDGKWFTRARKSIDPSDLIVLANHMIKWAFIGEPRRKPKPVKGAKRDEPFDPQTFVGILRSWGHSTDDAWQTTMVEFQREWEARNPLSEKERNQLTKKDADKVAEKAKAALARLKDQRAAKAKVAQSKAQARTNKR